MIRWSQLFLEDEEMIVNIIIYLFNNWSIRGVRYRNEKQI